MEPKKRVMKTSFSKRNLRGERMEEMVTFLAGVRSRSMSSSAGGEKVYIKGRWMDVRRMVPLPAMLRRVSGRRRRIRRSATLPRPKRNQKIARNPRN